MRALCRSCSCCPLRCGGVCEANEVVCWRQGRIHTVHMEVVVRGAATIFDRKLERAGREHVVVRFLYCDTPAAASGPDSARALF